MKTLLFCLAMCSSLWLYSLDVASQLKRLHYSFEPVQGQPFHLVTIPGGNIVCVGKKFVRNINNQVMLRLCAFWKIFITESQAKQLLRLNKKSKAKYPRWQTTFNNPKQSCLVIYEHAIIGECSDKRLAEAITTVAKVRFPLQVDLGYQEKMAILEILDMDQQIGRSKLPIPEKVKKMYSLDLALCPTDFSKAYIAHCHAWRETTIAPGAGVKMGANLGKAYGRNEQDAAAGALLGLLLEVSVYQDKIKKTYSEVLRIAKTYGVDVSGYR